MLYRHVFKAGGVNVFANLQTVTCPGLLKGFFFDYFGLIKAPFGEYVLFFLGFLSKSKPGFCPTSEDFSWPFWAKVIALNSAFAHVWRFFGQFLLLAMIGLLGIIV